MTNKKTGKKYKVVREGYYPNGKLAKPGSTVTLTKPTADKLLHRGIIEET